MSSIRLDITTDAAACRIVDNEDADRDGTLDVEGVIYVLERAAAQLRGFDPAGPPAPPYELAVPLRDVNGHTCATLEIVEDMPEVVHVIDAAGGRYDLEVPR